VYKPHRSLRPPRMTAEAGVNEIGANQVETFEVNLLNSPVLGMSIRMDSNVLDAMLQHVIVPFLGRRTHRHCRCIKL
jgi:hypothetical protein